MRGKVVATFSLYQVPGITPAYAGKSLSGAGCIRAEKDHPRLCGEKMITARRMQASSGSPPPMRGKEGANHERVEQCRITPAYAGKSI